MKPRRDCGNGFRPGTATYCRWFARVKACTFGEWADFFLENYSKPPIREPGTHIANLRCVQHLKKAFATRRLIDVDLTRSSSIFVSDFVSGRIRTGKGYVNGAC